MNDAEQVLNFSETEAVKVYLLKLRQKNQFRRRTEDVDYWRKRAGWYDDDKSMKNYNDGGYSQLNDDAVKESGRFGNAASSRWAKHVIQALLLIVALGLCFLMYRVLSRRLGEEKTEKKKRSASTGRGERTKSRSRSRSRSRKGEYDLMSDEDDGRSGRSSSNRSRSKSGRSRSRNRQRSRSASRRDSKSSQPASAEPVLV